LPGDLTGKSHTLANCIICFHRTIMHHSGCFGASRRKKDGSRSLPPSRVNRRLKVAS
jgi:hypothetical protein